ncbi:MAG: hypothetical protein KAI71_05890 [Candidatus Pacebacteria bacterium]|nr:hypothetical protein [Candidatus Paceibacterota bacterium]
MKKYFPYIIFAVVTLAIMFPLYQGGFIFLLDMVFVPRLDFGDYLKNGIGSGFPIIVLVKLFSFALPLEIIQKIILSLVLFLPGLFMFKLVKNFLPMKWAILSGLFYMLNPYVYERFLAGHWHVLLGYAFFPLLVKLFLEFLEKLDNKSFLKLAILFSVYPILSLHWAYISFWFLVLLGGVWFVVMLLSQKEKPKSILDALNLIFRSLSRPLGLLRDDKKKGTSHNDNKKLVKYFVYGAVLFFVVNSFWLVGFLSPSSGYYKFSLNDFRAFATQGDPSFWVFFNVLSLYGFWGTDYFLTKDFFQYWWVLTFVILGFAVYGVYVLLRKVVTHPLPLSRGELLYFRSRTSEIALILTLAIIFIPVVLLSVGYGSDITKPIINVLYAFLPGFKGLRETEKLVGLLAFSYAILVPIGGLAYAKKQRYVFTLLVLVPFLSVWTIFWGFNGQLKSSDYPKSWYQANEILKQDENNKLLFLPWHGYPKISFAGEKRVSNPAPRFFQVEVIAGKNIDNVYLLECDQEIWDKKMFQLLQGFETLNENIKFLRLEGITHIILAKEMDYEKYGFLDESEWLEIVLEEDDLVLYEIR